MDIVLNRISLQLHVAGQPERLTPVAQRMHRLAGTRLAEALARIEWGDDDDEAIVCIDRLALHCSVNSAWDDQTIAQQLAAQLALALQRQLAAVDTTAVRRFAGRADWIAAALVAFTLGDAARHWWLADFDGLLPLPASAALRTLVINEAEAGMAALARLTDAALSQLLATLADGDAQRLLAWVVQRPGLPGAPLLHAASALGPASGAHDWLQALLRIERGTPGAAGAAAVAALRTIVALQGWARSAGAALEPTAGEVTLPSLLAAAGLAADALAALPAAEQRLLLDQLGAGAASAAASVATRHGGLFVLLGRLQRLGWLATLRQRAGSALAADEADALTRALACRIAARALVDAPHDLLLLAEPAFEPCAAAAWPAQHDALARRALQALVCEPEPAPDDAVGLERALAAAAVRLLETFAAAVPGLAGCSVGYLRTQALALPARVQRQAQRGELQVRLGRAPLDVLLVLAGAKRQRIDLPGVPPLCCVEDAGEP